MQEKGILTVISGFSGVGKGTMIRRLMEKYPDQYALSVSVTTRKPRKGEVDGVHYFFLTQEKFEEMIRKNQLLEYAVYIDSSYGTPRDYVIGKLQQGIHVILEIEIQGALKVKAQYPDALLIFVIPPSAQELKRRLTGRNTESPEVISSRLSRASEEAQVMEAYDYVVTNDVLEESVEELHCLIQCSRNAVSRNLDKIRNMREEIQALL